MTLSRAARRAITRARSRLPFRLRQGCAEGLGESLAAPGGVSRRALMVGLSSWMAAATVGAPPKAQAQAWVAARAAVPPMPQLAPKRVTDGGHYTGAADSGYSAATLAVLNNAVMTDGDATVAKRGHAIPYRPEYGYFGPPSILSLAGATAAPILMNLTHPVTDTMFSADQVVGIRALAAALDGLAGGLVSLDFFFEGDTPWTVAAPTAGAVQVWGGDTLTQAVRNVGLYQAKILSSGMASGESANLYVRANPNLPGITPRIIGPFTFYRKDAPDLTLYLDTKAGAAGGATAFGPPVDNVSHFSDPRLLLNVLATTKASLWNDGSGPNTRAAHVLVNCADGCLIDFAAPFPNNAAAAAGRRGRTEFKALGTCTMKNSQWAKATCNYGTLDWTGWTADIGNWAGGEQTYARTHHYSVWRNCRIFSSSGGMDEKPGNYGIGSKTARGAAYGPFTGQLPAALLACGYGDCYPDDIYTTTVIGCSVSDMLSDAADVANVFPNGAGQYVSPPVCHAVNTYRNISGYNAYKPLDALTLSYSNGSRVGSYSIMGDDQGSQFAPMLNLVYTGAGTPSYDVTGSHGAYVPSEGGRTLTLRVDGTAVQSFTYGQTSTFGATTVTILTFGDLYRAINAFGNGWSVPGTAAAATAPPTANRLTGTISGNTLTLTSGTVTIGNALFSTVGGKTLARIAALKSGMQNAPGSRYTLSAAVVTAETSFGTCPGTPYLVSKLCTPTAYAGDILGMTIATFTGSLYGETLTVKPGLSGTIQVGQQPFKADGTFLKGRSYALTPYIKAFRTGRGGAGTYDFTYSGSGSETALQSSTVLGHYDTRTLILLVDGVPVKAFPTANWPGAGSPNGYYYIDDYTTLNNLTPNSNWDVWPPLPQGTRCTGLVGAINAFGDGWSASTVDRNGSPLPGTRYAANDLVGPVTLAILDSGAPSITQYGSRWAKVPLVGGTVTILAGEDEHTDFSQWALGTAEHVLICDNYATSILAQPMICASSAVTAHVNTAFVNNGIQSDLNTDNARVLAGQVSGKFIHFLMAHNTFATHRMFFQSDIVENAFVTPFALDRFSRVTNNFFDNLEMRTVARDGVTSVPGVDTARVLGQIRRNIMANLYPNSFDLRTFDTGNDYVNRSPAHPVINLTTKDKADFPPLAYGKVIDGTSQDFDAGHRVATNFTGNDFVPAPRGPLRTLFQRVPQEPYDASGVARDPAADLVGMRAKAAA